MKTFSRILVATDFGPSAAKAVNLAARLAKDTGADLLLLHVVEVPIFAFGGGLTGADMLTPLEESAKALMATELAELQKKCTQAKGRVESGIASDMVLETANDAGVDLIIVGTHGRTGMSRVLIGSVAEQIVRSAQVPVLTVRGER